MRKQIGLKLVTSRPGDLATKWAEKRHNTRKGKGASAYITINIATEQLTHHKKQVKLLNSIFLVTASFLLLNPIYANEKNTECIIRGGPDLSIVKYSGTCLFSKDKKGSFRIRKSEGEIIPSITQVSVYVLSPGVAEVRGLTSHGNNSRWGPAKRSQQDPACWTGSDFEVCAY